MTVNSKFVKIIVLLPFIVGFLTDCNQQASTQTDRNTLIKKPGEPDLALTESDLSNLIAYGKWTTSPAGDKLANLTFTVQRLQPADKESKDWLQLFDSTGVAVFSDEFFRIHEIYTKSLVLDDLGDQLIVRFGTGGSGSEVKIYAVRNARIENIVENESIKVREDVAFLPTSSNRGISGQPYQIVEFGADKIGTENEKTLRIFRYNEKKFRYIGSIYYRDMLAILKNNRKL